MNGRAWFAPTFCSAVYMAYMLTRTSAMKASRKQICDQGHGSGIEVDL